MLLTAKCWRNLETKTVLLCYHRQPFLNVPIHMRNLFNSWTETLVNISSEYNCVCCFHNYPLRSYKENGARKHQHWELWCIKETEKQSSPVSVWSLADSSFRGLCFPQQNGSGHWRAFVPWSVWNIKGSQIGISSPNSTHTLHILVLIFLNQSPVTESTLWKRSISLT